MTTTTMTCLRTLALAACLVASLATAPAATTPPADTPPLVYLPFDQAPNLNPGDQNVFLPYDKFIKLWELANPKQPEPPANKPPVAAALDAVTFTGKVKGDVAELKLEGTATALAKGWSTVELPGGLALNAFKAADKRVVLERAGNVLRLHLPEPGQYAFTAEVAVAVSRDAAGRRSLALVIPAAGAGRLDLTVPDKDAVIAAAPVVAATQVSLGNDGTRFLAVLGGHRQLAISWQPPVVESAGESLVLASEDMRLTVAERSLRYDLVTELTILRKPLALITVTVPADCQVLAVEGANLRTWELTGNALALHLHEAIDGRYTFRVRLERLLPALALGESRAVEVAYPTIAGAARATGSLVVVQGDGLGVAVDRHDGLSQIDPGELPEAFAKGALAAFRFLAAPAASALTITRLQPELRVDVQQLRRLGQEEDLIGAVINLDVRKAGVFALALSVPAAWEMVGVSGLNVDDIRTGAAEAGRKRIDLALRGRLIGAAQLVLRMRAAPSIPKDGKPVADLAVDLVLLPEARQQRGTLAVSAPRSWALTTGERSGLSAAEVEPLRHEGAMALLAKDLREDEELALGFTYLDAKASLHLAATARSRELTMRQEDLLTVADGLRRVSVFHGEVRYAALERLRLQAPSALDDKLVFKANNLAERSVVARDQGVSTWELRFQSPVIGAFTVTAEYLAKLPDLAAGKPTALVIEPLKPLEATRSTYIAAVAREGSMEVEATAAGLENVSPADLPAGLQVQGLVAGFQGPAPLPLSVKLVRHDLLALVDAAVVVARYTAVVSEDGLVRVKGEWLLSNRGRPYVELLLPKDADLLELAVDGRQGRPSKRPETGGVLVRLGDSGPLRNQEVAFVYEQKLASGKLGGSGALALDLPSLGHDQGAPAVPVERLELMLYLPDGLAVYGWSGDLHPVGDGEASLWTRLVERVAPRATGSDGDSPTINGAGLTVRFDAIGAEYDLRRLGDGGTVGLSYISHSRIEVFALLAAVAAGAAAWFARRRPGRVAGLILAPAIALLVVMPPWSAVLAGVLAGAVLAALAALIVVLWTTWRAARRDRALEKLASVGDPWLEPQAAPATATGDAPPTLPTNIATPPAAPPKPAGDQPANDQPGEGDKR